MKVMFAVVLRRSIEGYISRELEATCNLIVCFYASHRRNTVE